MFRDAINRVRDRMLQPKLQAAHESLQSGRIDEADSIVARILAAHPAQPDALHMKGVVAHLARQYAEARDCYERAIMVAPRFPEPYPGLAAVLARIGAPGELDAFAALAIQRLEAQPEALTAIGAQLLERAPACAARLFEIALRADPSDLAARCGAATLWARNGELERAHAAVRALLAESTEPLVLRAAAAVAFVSGGSLDGFPGIGESLVERSTLSADDEYNHVILLERLQGPARALIACDEMLERYPAHAPAQFFRASLRLRNGDFRGGFADYEARRRVEHIDTISESVLPSWDGSPLGARSIVISDEQGLGDGILFMRFLRDLRAREPTAKIAYACYASLYPWFAAQSWMQDIRVVRIDAINDWSSADCHAPLGSLPDLLGLAAPIGIAPPPYLVPLDALVAEWTTRLPPRRADRLRVGIVWAANPKQGVGKQRSIPAEALRPLLATSAIDWISLQVGVAPVLPEPFAGSIVDLGPAIIDFADTAAIIANLDLVISADTSPAHVAGAIGADCWVIAPHETDWRWRAEAGQSVWYPRTRVFRASADRGWRDAVEPAAAELARLVAGRG